MVLKIEMLRAYCAVAEAGNLADAAQSLGRTQSAVSMTLKQLEDHLGRPLFESDRKNRLTDLGQQVLHLAHSQILSFDATVQTLDLLAQTPQGLLKVAAVPSLAAAFFPHFVRRLGQEFPQAKIELRDTDTPQVIQALSSGWADIGIASASPGMNGVVATELFQDPFGLVMAETHPLAKQQEALTLKQVFEADFIRNELCDQIALPKFRAQLAGVDLTVRNLQSLVAMLKTGDWVSVLTPSVVPLAEGLVFRPIDGLNAHRSVCVLKRSQTAFPEIVARAEAVIIDFWS